MNAFHNLVDGKGLCPKEKLHILMKYVGGEAKETINDCFFIGSDEMYDEALDILKTTFGDPYLIAESFLHKLDNWPKIAFKDVTGLKKLSYFLRQCYAAMKTLADLEVLDTKGELKKVCKKLPDRLSDQWIRMQDDRQQKGAPRLKFKDLSHFISNEARILQKQQQTTTTETPKSRPPHSKERESSGL